MRMISLEEFFYSTKKHYYFIDGLTLKENKPKYELLHEIGISDDSYRTERLKEFVKNDNIKILLNYFNYKNIDINDKVKYEIILSKINYCVYYRNIDELSKLITQLNEYINENNILKPVFILYRVFALLNYDYQMSELKEMLKDDLNYLMLFRKKYFSNDMYYLYKIILYYFDLNKDTKELEQLTVSFKEYNWVYYNLKASKQYLSFNDLDSIIYYNKVLEYYQNDNNMERIFRTTATIAAILNAMNKYALSISKCEPLIEYCYSSKNDTWIKMITQHYLYAHFMMGNYSSIINFFEVIIFSIKDLSVISGIICIVSAYKLGDVKRAQVIIDNFVDDENVNIILKYIEDGRYNNDILSNLYPSKHMLGIIEKLKKSN